MRNWKVMGLVFVMAALSGLLRYTLSQLFPTSGGLNVTILIINLVGIFLLAYFVKGKWQGRLSDDWLTAIGTGFLGGFTTLASPLLDLVLALENENWHLVILLAFYYFFIGLGVAAISYRLGQNRVEADK